MGRGRHAIREGLCQGGYKFADASHVKNALARFDQVEDVSDADRDLAFANIKKAAKYYGINVEEKDWHDLGKRPHTKNKAHEKKGD